MLMGSHRFVKISMGQKSMFMYSKNIDEVLKDVSESKDVHGVRKYVRWFDNVS